MTGLIDSSQSFLSSELSDDVKPLPMDVADQLLAPFRLGDGQVLLLFDPRRSSLPNRPVPSHGARGRGHVAFHVAASQIETWRTHLAGRGIAIERERHREGGVQLYLRDPAGNSAELVAGEIWE